MIAKDYRSRILGLESDIYDLNYVVRQKDYEINEITIAVNDLRGKLFVIRFLHAFKFHFNLHIIKFSVKPSLKRVSKTDAQYILYYT